MMYLTQGLHRSAALFPDRIATIFGGRRQSWHALRDRVSRLAAGMIKLGLQPGDRVVAISLNSDRYLEVYLATAWCGAVIVPANTRWALPEHIFAINDCGAKLAFLDGHALPLAAELKAACPTLATHVAMDSASPVSLEQLIMESNPVEDRCGLDRELAAIFYTGGTTGRSKGVMLSHYSLIGNYLCWRSTVAATGRRLLPEGQDHQIYLHSPPMFHLADAALVYGITFTSGTHVVIPGFSPEKFVEAVEAERVTDVALVPIMLGMLADHLAQSGGDLSSVTNLSYGGSPISETVLRKAMAIFPNASITQAYGQTELSPCATLLLPHHHEAALHGRPWLRSAGQPLAGMEVKVIDRDGSERPSGEVGEVIVRGCGTMLGYWQQPDLTAQTLRDGWVHTGDAGYFDDDGFLYIVDRVKDMIISGGENVYSAEVENALASHPAIKNSAVIGVPDERWGERVHAIVELRDGLGTDPASIIAHCKDLIAGYKCPRTVEIRSNPLPVSAQGKILKNTLRQEYWSDNGRNVA